MDKNEKAKKDLLKEEKKIFSQKTKLSKLIDENKKILFDYNNCLKELDCFYRISNIESEPDQTIDDIIKNFLNLINISKEDSIIYCSCIQYKGKKYKNKDCKESKQFHLVKIFIKENNVGFVKICLKNKNLDEKKLLLLKEKTRFLKVIADRFGKVIEKKEIEEELKENKDYSTMIIDSYPNAFMIINQDKTIKNINLMFEKLTGFTGKEIIGKKPPYPWWLRKDKEINFKDIDMVVENNINRLIRVFKKKSGENFWVEMTSTPIINRNEKYFIINLADITERKNAEEKLKKSKEDLHILTSHLQFIRENERKKIAQEIHDELGQILTALKMDIHWIIKKINDEQNDIIDRSGSMIRLIDLAISSVQRISQELRPRLLDDFGLVAAIDWQIKEFIEHSGIKCDVLSMPESIDIEQDKAIAFFRIFQELLTNITRHSYATLVKINLMIEKNIIILEVSDNGKGFDTSVVYNPNSLGMIGMRERIDYLRGAMSIESNSNFGTKITIRIPIAKGEVKID